MIMRPHGVRHFRVCDSQVIQLVDHGNVDARRTWRAVAAVGALSVIGVRRSSCQNGSIIFFRVGCGLVGYGFIHVLYRVETSHDTGDSRAGERVVETLDWSQFNAER